NHLVKLDHLDDRVLAILARHRQTRLRACHAPLSVPAHRMIQEKLLPRVGFKPVALRQESSVVRLRRMKTRKLRQRGRLLPTDRLRHHPPPSLTGVLTPLHQLLNHSQRLPLIHRRASLINQRQHLSHLPRQRRNTPRVLRRIHRVRQNVTQLHQRFERLFGSNSPTEPPKLRISQLQATSLLKTRKAPDLRLCNPMWKPLSREGFWQDRKSTRLNSSHVSISYAVFCLKKKIYTQVYA